MVVPYLKNKVGVLRHTCEHNASGEARTCDPLELANYIKELHSRAIVIVGVYDELHLKLYREAVIRAGLNPLLMRVVDYRWGEQAIQYNTVLLQHNWAADMAPEADATFSFSRRDIIKGSVKAWKDRIDKPVYSADACNGLYRVCTLCQDSCPQKAISVDKKDGIAIKYDACNSCGLCVSSCPTGAIQFPSLPTPSLYDLAQVNGNKVISCYKDNGDSLKVPCLAMLTAEDLLALRGSGELTLRCPGCELDGNMEKVKKSAETINRSIGGITLEIKGIKQGPEKPAGFILRAQNRQEVREGVFKEHQDLAGLFLYDVNVNDELCTMCEDCAKWCPTNAISIERREDESSLNFDPMKCIGCNICTNVCPVSCNGQQKIITVNRGKSMDKKVLARDYTVKCRVCGAPVGSRKSIEHVKQVMKEKGMPVDDEWMELCSKHRSEYAFKKMYVTKFKPRGVAQVG